MFLQKEPPRRKSLAISIEAQDAILKPTALKLSRQDRIDQETLLRHEALSYFEREELRRWLQYNLSKIPLLSKTKRASMEKLRLGNYQDGVTCFFRTFYLISLTF